MTRRIVRIDILFLLLCLLVALQGCGVSKKQIRYSTSGGSNIGEKVVLSARKYIGTPYRYGGANPGRGFDCSGLTYYVYSRYGVKLPRSARDQMGAGRFVSRRKLEPGDLVFFKTSYYGGYHVGIFAGKGTFIHAPSSGKRVETQRLDTGYYRRKYIGARRVLPSS